MEKKHFIISNNYMLSTCDENCYLNGKKLIPNENSSNNKNIEVDISNKKNDVIKEFYNSFFQKAFKNIVILSAAGTSMDNGTVNINKKKASENDSKKEVTGVRGMTRDELWEYCTPEINKLADKIKDFNDKPFYNDKDIESLLSYMIIYEKLNGAVNETPIDSTAGGTSENGEVNETPIDSTEGGTFENGSKILNLKKQIECKIRNACNLTLSTQAPHINFLRKITARKASDARVQLFTTNYDTLFEQASNSAGFVLIDGFSFTHPRTFSGRYFDYDIVNREKTRIKSEDSYITNVIHLYKLHGSLDWEKNKDDRIIIKDKSSEPHIIYPSADKYESSYEQPYFEMMSRFQQVLRKDNVLMIIIGFGFKDKHIQNVIMEAVEQNPSFQLVIVNYNKDGSINPSDFEKYIYRENIDTNTHDSKTVKPRHNVTILYDTFSGFTDKYPENKTYTYKDEYNQTIQS